jgi:ADP-ribosylglycohydrolase
MTADSSSYGPLERALASLRGLAVGDALGSQFFVPANYPLLKRRELPAGPWQWTDDTEMACSVVAVLATHHRIDQDALALSFAEHHDFDRGYGPAVNRLLRLIREGGDWRELSAALFKGQGSWGNGAAMRIAPLGAWYADDPEQATHQAEISAYPTHQHREAVVGARVPPRRRRRSRAEERGGSRTAPGPGHARLRRRCHRRGRTGLRAAHLGS